MPFVRFIQFSLVLLLLIIVMTADALTVKPTVADWEVDLTIPGLSVTVPICVDSTNWPTPTYNATELNPSDSGFSSCQYKLDATTNTLTYPVDPKTTTCSQSVPVPSLGNHTLVITVTDNAGNVNTATRNFEVKNICNPPWIQTTGGDVHSNGTITLPQ